jgi:membrane-associated PAP2 superfamily phosphatase
MPEIAAAEFEATAQHTGASVRRRTWSALGKATRATICAPAVWIPALVLLGLTAVFRFSDADINLARWFYAGGTGSQADDCWPLTTAQPWAALYNWGCYPGLVFGCGGLAVWLVSFCWKKLEPCRDAGLFYALLLLLGPGVLVNGVCKPCWERPRPHATILFGGEREFVRVLERGQGEEDSSFPSGHAAMGFYLMAPAFVVYRRRRRLASAFLLLGLTSGVVIGLARIVAGCHFASDVLWSGGVVYFTALLLAAPFRFGKASRVAEASLSALRCQT